MYVHQHQAGPSCICPIVGAGSLSAMLHHGEIVSSLLKDMLTVQATRARHKAFSFTRLCLFHIDAQYCACALSSPICHAAQHHYCWQHHYCSIGWHASLPLSQHQPCSCCQCTGSHTCDAAKAMHSTPAAGHYPAGQTRAATRGTPLRCA